MIHKTIIDNQLYLYMNGKLIYKRWLLNGQSFVFDVMPYTKWDSIVSIKLSIKKNVNFSYQF